MRYVTTRPMTLQSGSIKLEPNIASRYGDKLKAVKDGYYMVLLPIQLKVGLLVDFDKEPPKWATGFLEDTQPAKASKKSQR